MSDRPVSPPRANVAGERRARTVFMFSGQGSQYYHMGRRLYEREPVFRETLDELDAQAQQELGESVLEYLYRNDHRPEDAFDAFRYTQPAIFMVEYALARLLMSYGIVPEMVLGASLGELAAAAVAGALEPRDCLALLVRQVSVFESRCPRGGMLAVLADPDLFETNEVLHANSELAAVNSRSNFVVAGREPALLRIERHLAEKRILFQRLPVRFAFHSSQIEAVEAEVKALLRTVKSRPSRIPFVSCTAGAEARQFEPECFWDVLRRPFHPGRVIGELEASGPFVYLDLGPSGTLWTLVRSQLAQGSSSRTLPLMSPYAQEPKLLADVLRLFDRPGIAIAEAGPEAPRAVRKSLLSNDTGTMPMKTNKLKVYAFPGQGSQFKGMGRELFEQFTDLGAKADAILGYSIRTLCVEDPEGRLGRTDYTQPALYVVNALTYLKTLQDGAVLPDYLLGHSLGEYDALFAAGVFDFETGLRLVKRRAELMGRVNGGSMAAVIGCDVAKIREILDGHGLSDVDVANYNAPSQAVIAGPRESIAAAGPIFERVPARYVPLNVSAPFHSRYMKGAAAEFGKYLDGFELGTPKIPVIANVDARPYGGGDVKARLQQQITRPVLWTDSIRYLMGRGTPEVKELGPGRVLAGLVTKILAEATPLVADGDADPHPATTDDRADGSHPNGNGSVRALGTATPARSFTLTAEMLGSRRFREDYGVRYAYVAGGMHRGISSRGLVARMAQAGFMAYYGTRGVPPGEVDDSIRGLQAELRGGESFGMNLTYDPFKPRLETELVDLFLRRGVRFVEVSAYPEITPALVKYRLKGLTAGPGGRATPAHRLMAKVSRPEIAREFLSPAPERLVRRLREQGEISAEEAELAARVPMVDDLCAQADAGGHTEMGVMAALLPSIVRLRDEVGRDSVFARDVRVGAAGGIGTAVAAAAAFILGADFILTGSVNQCTAEAATSTRAKDMLQQLDVQDTTYAPSGEMFELGARVRVMKRGVFFHARATRLYDLWRNYDRWEDIAADTRKQIEERYLRASFEEVHEQARRTQSAEDLQRSERDPKHRMALVFRWYCDRATLLALQGAEHELDYQVYCGPALGAFNQWVKGTELEDWRNRHVDQLGRKIMDGAAALFSEKWNAISAG